MEIAQDCFHFITKFFEPINVSATHIYHSALELCPTSSIVRKLYYDQCHGITQFPRITIGTPDSWDPTMSFSGKGDYGSCTWSPCGQFIAAQTKGTVEIRNQLTFELLTTFHSTENTSSICPLAYSPNGQSLACGFSHAIVIWDIQTGGVVKEIKNQSDTHFLAWSLDGVKIAAYLHDKSAVIYTGSGTCLSRFQFNISTVCHLWGCKKSILALALTPNRNVLTVSIRNLEHANTPIKSINITTKSMSPPFPLSSFSQSTQHVSIFVDGTLRVVDSQLPNHCCLLEEIGNFTCSQFSPNGNFFAASHQDGVRIWECGSGSYILWGEYLFPYLTFSTQSKPSLQFSPTSSSILSHCGNFLQLRRLHDPPKNTVKSCQYAAVSCFGKYIATAHKLESTVTINNLLSQTPPHFINTGMEIEGLAITGKILLVASSDKVVAWLLTEEGAVDGTLNKRADQNNSIWTVSSPFQHSQLCFRSIVGAQVGVIGSENVLPFVYCTETGDLPNRVHEPQQFSFPWVSFYQPSDFREYYHLLCCNPSEHNIPPKDSWIALPEAGWMRDPKWKYRLWIPVEWRKCWGQENWHHNITTLFARVGDQPIIIKF